MRNYFCKLSNRVQMEVISNQCFAFIIKNILHVKKNQTTMFIAALIVSYEAIVGISSLLSLIGDRMPWNNEKQVHRNANLLSRLLTLMWTQKEYSPAELQLLKALFRLHLRDIAERSEEDGESLTANIVEETWTKGILELSKRFSPVSYANHVKYFASLIWQNILQT